MTNLVILDGIGYIQTGDKLVSATPAEYVAEIERLSSALRTANANHERFEREWYLRGDEIERLRAQLPAEMQHCTIRFIECEKGHGRLVGTNWIDPGCLKCEVDRLSRSSAEPSQPRTTCRHPREARGLTGCLLCGTTL